MMIRIQEVESYGNRFTVINDQIDDLRNGLNRALQPKGPQITDDDVQNWNRNMSKTKDLENTIAQLRKEMNMIDGPKLKADILQLFKITNTFVTNDDITGLKEDLRRVKAEVADCNYDVTACKDIVQKSEKTIEANQKANAQEFQQVRTRLDAIDQSIAGLKKSIGMLDAKNKNNSKSAALNANPALAGQVLQSLEEGLQKLREDHEELKVKQDKDNRNAVMDLDTKATKQQLADLEAKLLQQLQDMAAQMREMFPDKEAVRKKLREIQEKVIRLIFYFCS